MNKEIEYPVRINRYLASKKVCSRREADELIRSGKVTINSRVAVLGDKVEKDDNVFVDEKAQNKKKLVYYAYHKPRGIVTHSPQGDEKDILSISKFAEKVFPLGRLDKDSYGLILLTNDGRITDQLLNPDNYHKKEYVVGVEKNVNSAFLHGLRCGVVLDDGYVARECEVEKLGATSFRIVLTEGKRRQIRRMCERMG